MTALLWLRQVLALAVKEFLTVLKDPKSRFVVIGPPISAQGRSPRETNLVVQEWIEGKMREISSAYGAKVD